MRRPRDAGSAVVEVVVVGVLLLLPLIALVVVVSRVQAAAFAVDAGARSAALAVAAGAGEGGAQAAVALALADQGFDDGPPAEVVVTCEPVGCKEPGARVEVQVRYRVGLALPALVEQLLPVSEPLEARATATVDRFAPAPP